MLKAATRAEWLKLRKRPAVWIMTGTLALVVLLFGYVLLWAIVTQAPPEAGVGLDGALMLSLLSPANLPGQVLGLAVSFGAPLGLILGALAIGSEFSWKTVKTTTTQHPRRTVLLAGQALALLGVCGLFTLAAFAGGAAGTAAISALEPLPTTAPVVADVVAAVGCTWLIITVYCALGASLAMLFRATGWAIGVGLLYLFAVEQVLPLLPLRGRAADLLQQALLGSNANALVAWLSPESTQALGATVTIPVLQAIVVLVAYTAVALAVATVVFARRDIA